jgi:hypothetical protein
LSRSCNNAFLIAHLKYLPNFERFGTRRGAKSFDAAQQVKDRPEIQLEVHSTV